MPSTFDEHASAACESTSASRQTEAAHHLLAAPRPGASDFPSDTMTKAESRSEPRPPEAPSRTR